MCVSYTLSIRLVNLMPHRCTRCGTVFEDGDAAILSGCPNCGWNKFLYVKKEAEGSDKEKVELEEEKTGLESSLDEIVRNIDETLNLEKETKIHEPESEKKEDTERVESVKILGPGSYELNLDSLLERKELVMAIKEEGSYALHLPSVFNQQKENSKFKKK